MSPATSISKTTRIWTKKALPRSAQWLAQQEWRQLSPFTTPRQVSAYARTSRWKRYSCTGPLSSLPHYSVALSRSDSTKGVNPIAYESNGNDWVRSQYPGINFIKGVVLSA